MWNGFAYNKRNAFNVAFIAFIMLIFCIFLFDGKYSALSFANDKSLEDELSSGVESVLDDIDSSDLDEYIENDFNLSFFDVGSFKDIVVNILNGNFFQEYDSLFQGLLSISKQNISNILLILVSIIVVVLLYEIFKTFCVDKFGDLKKIVKIVFSLIVVLLVSVIVKNLSTTLSNVISKMFNFVKVLFPILLTTLLVSGASTTHSVYGALSAFLINTGAYVFNYVLLPISLSILVLSLIGSIFKNKQFEKTIDLLKTVFKYVIGLLFGIFGLFSVLNVITSGVKDGVGLKLTKFAIKNYIPVLGGYISDGFNFVQAGSVLVKNAFGICGVIVLMFLVIKPLVLYFVCIISFKVLSVVVSYISSDFYSDMFDNVSKCIGYFVAVLVGLFLMMFAIIYLIIISVSVV